MCLSGQVRDGGLALSAMLLYFIVEHMFSTRKYIFWVLCIIQAYDTEIRSLACINRINSELSVFWT